MKVNLGGWPRKDNPVPIDAFVQGSAGSPVGASAPPSTKVPQMNISNYLNFGGNPHIDQGDDVINGGVDLETEDELMKNISNYNCLLE